MALVVGRRIQRTVILLLVFIFILFGVIGLSLIARQQGAWDGVLSNLRPASYKYSPHLSKSSLEAAASAALIQVGKSRYYFDDKATAFCTILSKDNQYESLIELVKVVELL